MYRSPNNAPPLLLSAATQQTNLVHFRKGWFALTWSMNGHDFKRRPATRQSWRVIRLTCCSSNLNRRNPSANERPSPMFENCAGLVGWIALVIALFALIQSLRNLRGIRRFRTPNWPRVVSEVLKAERACVDDDEDEKTIVDPPKWRTAPCDNYSEN